MNPSHELPVTKLFVGLPRLARLATLGARLQAAADALESQGHTGIQIIVFCRRFVRHSVRHGHLPFWFEAELVSRGRKRLSELLETHKPNQAMMTLTAAELATLAEFGRPPDPLALGMYLIPLMADDRMIGIISLAMQSELPAEDSASLITWSEILSSFISNDIRIGHYEELELLMRSLRREHDLAGVLAVVVDALANEYGSAAAVWRRERVSWLQMAASPVSQRLNGLDLAPLSSGEEGLIALGGCVGVPIIVEERLWGALVVDEPLVDGERWHFLRSVGRHSELALENALAFERHRQFALESAALSDAGRTLLEYTRVEPLSGAIARLAVDLGEAEHAALYLEAESGGYVCAGNSPRSGYEPLAITDEELRAAVCERTSLIERPDRLVLLPFGDRSSSSERAQIRGCLAIRRSAQSPSITQETVRLLEAFATLGALALGNARLFENSTEANRALAESNAFKDDLLAMFTHDFKTPLTVISGYGELVLETLVGEERESVAIILSQVKRLATLADDALALARAQATGFALERSSGELVAFVRDLITMSFGNVHDRLVVEPRIEELWLSFDPHALRHILENIIGNALKYSDSVVRLEVLRERNEAAVIVRDRGIGIPADELVHVFGRFSRASNARRRGISGSGVGLYIANRLVEEHGGAIFVSSCEGTGSTFEVRLPLIP